MHGHVLQLTTHSPVCHAFVGNAVIVRLVRPVMVLSLGLHGLVFFVDDGDRSRTCHVRTKMFHRVRVSLI